MKSELVGHLSFMRKIVLLIIILMHQNVFSVTHMCKWVGDQHKMCKQKFDTQESLVEHVEKHIDDEKGSPCCFWKKSDGDICYKELRTKQGIKNHVRDHRGLYKLVCGWVFEDETTCAECFYDVSDLDKHFTKHEKREQEINTLKEPKKPVVKQKTKSSGQYHCRWIVSRNKTMCSHSFDQEVQLLQHIVDDHFAQSSGCCLWKELGSDKWCGVSVWVDPSDDKVLAHFKKHLGIVVEPKAKTEQEQTQQVQEKNPNAKDKEEVQEPVVVVEPVVTKENAKEPEIVEQQQPAIPVFYSEDIPHALVIRTEQIPQQTSPLSPPQPKTPKQKRQQKTSPKKSPKENPYAKVYEPQDIDNEGDELIVYEPYKSPKGKAIWKKGELFGKRVLEVTHGDQIMYQDPEYRSHPDRFVLI